MAVGRVRGRGRAREESSLQVCHNRKLLLMVAHQEQNDPGALAEDPTRGGLGLLFGVPHKRRIGAAQYKNITQSR